MVLIYVLQLRMNKWYIGKANDNHPEHRLEEHFTKNGSDYTKIYPPIKVFEVYPNSSHSDENKITLEYMEKYGIDNVRGGAFCQINLDQPTINFIEKMLQTSGDLCFGCGKRGHFLKQCSRKKQNASSPSISSEDTSQLCSICGSKDHNISDCLTNLAKPIEVLKLCMLCGSKDHNMDACSTMKEKPSVKKTLCYMCGSTHAPDDCMFIIKDTKPEVAEKISDILCEKCGLGFSTNIKLITHKLECIDKEKSEIKDNKSDSCCMQ
jgi:predicted GIY-YIG superfamily endonuclease